MCVDCWQRRNLPQLPKEFKDIGIEWIHGLRQESNDLMRMYSQRVIMYLFQLETDEVLEKLKTMKRIKLD